MSPAHVRWFSIELLHNVVRTLRYLEERDGTPLPSVTYRGKVKLHGTNCAVQVTPDGVFPQSRSKMLSASDDYKGFARRVGEQLAYWEGLDLDRPAIVFGEWCGPGVEKGMAVSGIPYKVFAVFGIQYGYGGDARVVYEPDEIGAVLPPHPQIHVLPWLGEAVTLDYGDEARMEQATDAVNRQVAEVDRADPWVREVFGVEGIGEGVVYYPVGGDATGDAERLSLLMFKAKGERHRGAATKDAAQTRPEVAEGVEDFAAMMVTEARIEQGVSEACGGTYEMRRMGPFIRWVADDVRKESVAELEAAGLAWEQVAKAVQGVARDWYKARVGG